MTALEGHDVHRIRLSNTEFEGKNNVYVLGHGDSGPVTLVDTGVATDAVRRNLEDGLRELDLTLADVDQILLTHWHSDHAGLAGTIQEESGASVHVHEADAGLVDGSDRDRFSRARREQFRRWGMPAGTRRELVAFLERHSDRAGTPPTVDTFDAGTVFTAGGRSLEAVHLPGHAAGLTAFVDRRSARREAFVGDAILPKYTPNIGGADVRVQAPVETYLTSLRWFVTGDLDRAWPGHRDPIDDPVARARTIIGHHRERTERVLSVVSERGPLDAWEVSAALFGDLEGIHVMHGPGEAHAHLDHLERAGIVRRDGTNYELADASDDRIDGLLDRMR